jgi:hypothetical protein
MGGYALLVSGNTVNLSISATKTVIPEVFLIGNLVVTA